MKKFCCLVLALLLLVITPVAASDMYREVLTDSKVISKEYDFTTTGSGSGWWVRSGNFQMTFANIENWPDVNVVYVRNPVLFISDIENLTLAKSQDGIPHYVDFIVSDTNDNIGNGYLTYNIFYDANKRPITIQFWVEFNEWNVTGLAGQKQILMQLNPDSPLTEFEYLYYTPIEDLSEDRPVVIGGARELPKKAGM